jgi:hypothetical protein
MGPMTELIDCSISLTLRPNIILRNGVPSLGADRKIIIAMVVEAINDNTPLIICNPYRVLRPEVIISFQVGFM